MARSKTTTYLICAAAWAVPGPAICGSAGDRRVGALVALPLMFMFGLSLDGRLFPFELRQPLVALAAFADIGMGVPYFIARRWGGPGTSSPRTSSTATRF